MGWHQPIIEFQKRNPMNFRHLPPPVQDALKAALLQILRETPLLKYPAVEYCQRIDDAVALCCPHFDFADLHGEDLRSMQMSLAHKHVFGRFLLAVSEPKLELLSDHLRRYLEIRPTIAATNTRTNRTKKIMSPTYQKSK